MTERPTTEERLRALQTVRNSGPTEPPTPPTTPDPSPSPASVGVHKDRRATRRTSTGPAPSRIIAAAASVSAGIGLVALMAGAQQDVVVQVNPTPVVVQPASIVVEMQPGADGDATGQPLISHVEVRTVASAEPAERPAPQARVVSQSEGS